MTVGFRPETWSAYVSMNAWPGCGCSSLDSLPSRTALLRGSWGVHGWIRTLRSTLTDKPMLMIRINAGWMGVVCHSVGFSIQKGSDQVSLVDKSPIACPNYLG